MPLAMTSGMKNPVQVVVAYDFSHSATAALERSLALAQRAPWHVLHVLCVVEPHVALPAVPRKGPVDFAYAERVQQAVTDVIARALHAAGTTERVQFYVHARIGHAAQEILQLAEDVGAELVLVGSKGLTGVERLVLGSVAEKVVREAGCTVEVVRRTSYKHVELANIIEIHQPHRYVPPHRYSYEDRQVVRRPDEWPLY